MSQLLFKFHVATAINGSLYNNYVKTILYELQVVKGAEVGKW